MNYDHLDNNEFILRLKNKDSLAWKELYTTFAGKLTAICKRYIKSNDDLRDVLQNCFVKMFSQIEFFDYKGRGSLSAWSCKILVNESLQFLRTKGFNFDENVDLESIDISEVDEKLDSITNELTQTEIISIIQNLPLGYRTVFNLYVFEEKTHAEIAQLLNITEGTSASQFSRAKKILAIQIKEFQQSKMEVS